MNKGWHILRDGDGLILARHLPPRFDVAAETHLPSGHPLCLAHQIRQDMWRALQRVRGFSPVVRVETREEGLKIIAGGRAASPIAPALADRIAAVLAEPANRARWTAQARRRATEGRAQ